MVRRVLVAVVLFAVAGCPQREPRPEDDGRHAPHEEKATALVCATLQSCTDACADGDCATKCALRLTTAAKPFYDALQACVKPACADADAGAAPCRVPNSFGCKMCVLGHCAAQASRCMAN
jgi:hypothetical protein